MNHETDRTHRCGVLVLAILLGLSTLSMQAAMQAELLLSADSLALGDGAAVSSWTDSSGFGRNANQGSGSEQPTFKAGILNGLPVIHFTGAGGNEPTAKNDLIVDFASDVSQPLTFFIVARIDGNNALGATPGDTWGKNTDVIFDTAIHSDPNRITAGLYGGGALSPFGIYAGPGSLPTGTVAGVALGWQIYELHFNGASSTVYTNGATYFTGTVDTHGIYAANDLRIGASEDGTQPFNGDIAEFRVYSGTPTSAERTAIGKALSSKYGMTSSYGLTVSITSPADNSKLLVGTVTNITASAIDTDGTITNVAFYKDGVLIGQASTAPYSVAWTPSAAGTNILTARAWDNQGVETLSAGINVVVSVLPLNNLALWLKADAIVGSNGDSISTWADSSGSGNNALQGTPANQPIFVTNALNGLPVVRFNGIRQTNGTTQSYLDIASLPIPQPFTVLIVAKINGNHDSGGADLNSLDALPPLWAGASDVLFDSTGAVNRIVMAINPTGTDENHFMIYDGGATVLDAPEARSVWTNWNVWEGFYNGESSAILKDGSPQTVSGSIGAGSLSYMRIGTYMGPDYNGLNGDIAEILVYSKALDLTERQLAEGVLAWKYGMQGSLPFDHPYKNVDPAVGGNLPPAVSITSPTNNSILLVGTVTNITASANDPDGSITNVAFYQDGVLIGQDSTAPYSVAWNAATSGTYALTAQAWDNQGASTLSATTTVFVNQAPTVSITSPTNSSLLVTGTQTLTVSAGDTDGSVTNVEFYVDGQSIGTDTSSPFSLVWNAVPPGTYALTVRAWDNQGASTLSATTTVFVDQAPTVSITSPGNGSVLAPGAQTLMASAGDTDGFVTNVEFYVDGQSIGTDSSSPYSIVWNAVTPGTYALTARAWDNQGVSTLSASTTVSVNHAPAVSITSPGNGSVLVPGAQTLTAVAGDTDGSVTNVEFYVDGQSIGTDTSTPYSMVWNVATPGTYALTARAWDNQGATTLSSTATVQVSAQMAMHAELLFAADGMALSDGAAVSSWTDTSGFGRNATQATGSLQPTFKTGILNGLPVIRFAGAGGASPTEIDLLDVDFTTSITQPLTFFVVAKINGNNSGAYGPHTDVMFDDVANVSRVSAGLYGGPPNSTFGMYASATNGHSGPTGTVAGVALGWQIYEICFNGASSVCFTNGAVYFTGAVDANGITAVGDLRIGARTGDTYNQPLNGDIAEFRLYSGTPTEAERNAIGYALATKYGLTTGYVRSSLVSANADADALISDGLNNCGGLGAFQVGGFGQMQRSVMRFDVSAVPNMGRQLQVDSIVLQMRTSYLSNSNLLGDRILSVYQVTNAWTEGVGLAQAGDTADVTWTNRMTGVPWVTVGGDFNPTVLGSFNWMGFPDSFPVYDARNDAITLEILPGAGNQEARNALINSWLNGANYGLMLRNNSEGGDLAMGIRSRENAGGAGAYPKLQIIYTVLPPAGTVFSIR